ncbi:MAG: hypothetical protein C4K47_09280 [Candidatus Thorarchaeota archaeon]|nr:MAG: hypothetical protein C4K47_09280 [Candidatus Thorarchaeota archaeon]
MYVKIRKDGAVGLGRGSEGIAEITLGYGEAHMVAAALEKLAQTARSYKQSYVKTTDVGSGNKIDFERTPDGALIVSGDGHSYSCTEEEVREVAEVLRHLPPVQALPSSDYAQKVQPQDGFCVAVKSGGKSLRLKLHESALLKTAIITSIDSRFYQENIVIGKRRIGVQRTSDLKWELSVDDDKIKFTAYEIESLVNGLHNGTLDVLMDLVKSMGSDKIADIRIKSVIQRIEQDATKILEQEKRARGIVRSLTRSAEKILGPGSDADARTKEFIDMCKFVYSTVEPAFDEPLFNLFTAVYVSAGGSA